MPTHKTRQFTFATFFVAFAGVFAMTLGHTTGVAAKSDPPPNTEAFYTQKVQPIFRNNCYRCHGSPNHRGGLQLDTKTGLLRGGKDGAVIVPGHPEQSLLVSLIRHEGPADDPMPMPPHDKLSDADIATITTWIKAGAVMPDAPAN